MTWASRLEKFGSAFAAVPPASTDAIEHCENTLAVTLPEQLRTLLLHSNGLFDSTECSLIWSVEEIEQKNIEFRAQEAFVELYMPFDHLLFFGDTGGGDQFAVPILGGEIRGQDVFLWNHENDSRTWIAADILQLLDFWASGKLDSWI